MISSEGKRYLSGIVFIPILILLSGLGGLFFLFLIDLVILLGSIEFYGMARRKGTNPLMVPGIASGLILSWFAYWTGGTNLVPVLTLVLIALMITELMRKDPSNALYRIAATELGVVYVGLMASHLVLLRELPRITGESYGAGSRYVLLVFLVTWGCDTAAYLIGRRWGRHPLIERVSPKKSVEGSVGGLVFAVAFSLLAKFWFAGFLSLGQSLSLGLLVGAFGQLGDLVESLIKRDVNTKDSSGTIPGHGGVLDRFDSLLFTAPLAYYYLRILLR
jgi:phosphatidate cytidylyltransferase